jgi:excinuclease ABC subunit A
MKKGKEPLFLEVEGARENNLKDVSVRIPRNALVVFTGLSGSGKSSLAFDTIFAEGQRRYMESFSVYARQFIGQMERPDVDRIDGLMPVISIEQKTVNRNPRSTVGTVTEIYDFLRLLFAKVGTAYSYISGLPMRKYTEQQILDEMGVRFSGKKLAILSPIVRGRKGHYRELFEQYRKQGYTRMRIDGVMTELVPNLRVDRYKIHDIELVVDRIVLDLPVDQRVIKSVQLALKMGKGIFQVLDLETDTLHWFSKFMMDAENGLAYDEPQPNTFSFNSPYGACSECEGMGTVSEVDVAALIPDPQKTILTGAIAPLGEYRDIWIFKVLKALSKRHKFNLSAPISDWKPEHVHLVLYGDQEPLEIPSIHYFKETDLIEFEGVVAMVRRSLDQHDNENMRSWAEEFVTTVPCPSCQGGRLKKEALHYKIGGKNISEFAQSELDDLAQWLENIPPFEGKDALVAHEILKEIKVRLGFLRDIGLGYLNLNRGSATLSGGESQRIRLATQIGSQLVGVLYILDEPSIGLHQRDNLQLIQSLKNLRDLGNSVLVVEHDKDMILKADYVVDIGPGAGIHGGEIIGQGSPKEFLKQKTVTADYLVGRKGIPFNQNPRLGNGNFLTLLGAKGNNLKDVSIQIPLGTLVLVTGVSGSGKSTLVKETLYLALNNHFWGSKKKPLPFESLNGLEYLDKVIEIDQAPIGRTPRSNPATYVEVFSSIRNFYATLPEAKIRGYKPGRFSFNVSGGRCETCKGAGVRVIEMNFLPDVQVKCEACQGRRYNRETLEVRYKGKSINDVLNLSIEDAIPFFEAFPQISRKLQALNDVGLGYITLGQPSTTLSGGEAQRVKLATELSKKDTGKTLYILDEPTTGLHFQDVDILLGVLQKLVEKGNTVVIIEHHMDLIKSADYLIDVGPEAGKRGGTVTFQGTPMEMLSLKESNHTARFLAMEWEQEKR